MAELTVDTPSPDDVGYEWRREQLLEQGIEPPAGPAAPVITGTLHDQHGRRIQVGASGGKGEIMPAGRCVLPPDRAEDFAQAYNTACWTAAAQWALEAATGGTCPADCGAQAHDETCRSTSG